MKEKAILINKEIVINLITIFSLPVIIILSPTGPQNELIKLPNTSITNISDN